MQNNTTTTIFKKLRNTVEIVKNNLENNKFANCKMRHVLNSKYDSYEKLL